MARPKKVYQTPVIESVEEIVETPVVEAVQPKKEPVLIPLDGNVVSRRSPTLEVKHIVSNLIPGHAYKIKTTVRSAIYGEFYLLENGLYVAKISNVTVKE